MNSKDDFQFGFSPGNFNDVEPEVYMFVPELDAEEYLENVEINSKSTENGYIIEVRIDARLFDDINVNKKSEMVVPEKKGLVSNRDKLAGGLDSYSDQSGAVFVF